MSTRIRDERGVVLPTRLMVLCISAVALSALAFIATVPGSDDDRASIVVAKPTATPTPTPTPTVVAKPAPVINRGAIYVEVYNNSSVKGLATTVAGKASGVGWNVVGSDNWYGTIDSSTVYYPDRLTDAAKALARDLGVKRLKPAVAPMRLDRLTVILTSDYRP